LPPLLSQWVVIDLRDPSQGLPDLVEVHLLHLGQPTPNFEALKGVLVQEERDLCRLALQIFLIATTATKDDGRPKVTLIIPMIAAAERTMMLSKEELTSSLSKKDWDGVDSMRIGRE